MILFTPAQLVTAQHIQRDTLDNAILDTFMAAQRNGENLTAKDIAQALNEKERTIQYRVQKIKERIAVV
jgi:DNA-binding Lrp family transcriptional regulator